MKKNRFLFLSTAATMLLVVFAISTDVFGLTVSLTIVPAADSTEDSAPATSPQGGGGGSTAPSISPQVSTPKVGSIVINGITYPTLEWFVNKDPKQFFVFYGTSQSYEFGPYQVKLDDGLTYLYILKNIHAPGNVFYKIIFVDKDGKYFVLESGFYWGGAAPKSEKEKFFAIDENKSNRIISPVRPLEKFVYTTTTDGSKILSENGETYTEKRYMVASKEKRNCSVLPSLP